MVRQERIKRVKSEAIEKRRVWEAFDSVPFQAVKNHAKSVLM
jgi:hypothetical protein